MTAAPRFVVVGNPASRRVAFFLEALARRGVAPARVVPWVDLLDGAASLVLAPGDLLRIESPGEHPGVERRLLALGADPLAREESPASWVPAADALALPEERGRILHPRQWYLGFREALGRIAAALDASPGALALTDPREVPALFDKRLTHARLAAAGVPVAPSMGAVGSFDELRERMRSLGWERAFVKLAYGSSASGVLAYTVARGREYALTSMHETSPGAYRNALRVSRYVRPDAIARAVDFLLREGAQVERWLPKASQRARPLDLRVVTVGGRAMHHVVRLGRGPMTNLHLGNARGDAARLRASVGEGRWAAAMSDCERAARCFPGCLALGVDLLLEPGYERRAVLEANAFGDLLPGVGFEGDDTYGAQVAAALDYHASLTSGATSTTAVAVMASKP